MQTFQAHWPGAEAAYSWHVHRICLMLQSHLPHAECSSKEALNSASSSITMILDEGALWQACSARFYLPCIITSPHSQSSHNLAWSVSAPSDSVQVVVNYVAMTPQGKVFDSSLEKGKPYDIRVGSGAVIPGLDEGIRGMKPGGIRRLYIPGNLAFPKVGLRCELPSGPLEHLLTRRMCTHGWDRHSLGVSLALGDQKLEKGMRPQDIIFPNELIEQTVSWLTLKAVHLTLKVKRNPKLYCSALGAFG